MLTENSIRNELSLKFQKDVKLNPLFGMGFGTVFDLKVGEQEFIVKATPEPREQFFYDRIEDSQNKQHMQLKIKEPNPHRSCRVNLLIGLLFKIKRVCV